MTHDAAHELVPLADRLRFLRAFRASVVAILLVTVAVLPVVRTAVDLGELAVVGAWLAATLAFEGVWRLLSGRALWLFGAMLIADGLLLVWFTYVAVPVDSPLRYLLVLHVVAVSLLASHRTGLKLAMWNSLLLLATYHADEVGLLQATTSYRALMVVILLVWAAAISTSAFSAANERELRRRRYDLEALGRLALALEGRGNPVLVAERLCAATADDFGFPRVAVFAVADGRVTLLHATGGGTDVADPAPLVEQPTLDRAAAQTRPLLVTRAPDDPLLAAVLPDGRNLALIPMRADDRMVGALVCEHGLRTGSRVEQRVLSMLERYASHAALALSNASLIDELERSARIDALTGVANRRVFDAELARELGRASRHDGPVSLLMLDVDHFKRLNDSFGHIAGDVALAALGAALSERIRTEDTLARFGGEEFALILPGLDEDLALEAAERLRVVARGLNIDPGITVSVGVASFPAAGRDPLTLLAAADDALYRAKSAGRDAVAGSSARSAQGKAGIRR